MIKSLLRPIKYLASDDFRLRFQKWRTLCVADSRLGRYLLHRKYNTPTEHLELEAFGMKFSSPVGLAAGYDTDGRMIDAMEATGFGFVEVGSITAQPQQRGTFPSLYRLENDRALLYNGEFESCGLERTIENIKRHNSRIVVGCNIAKSATTAAEDAPLEYLRLFRPLYQYADYFTVNICGSSCYF